MEGMEYKEIPGCDNATWKRDLMKEPDEVAAMLRLRGLGWGLRRIAKELRLSKNTVKHYLRQGGWVAMRRRERTRALGGLCPRCAPPGSELTALRTRDGGEFTEEKRRGDL